MSLQHLFTTAQHSHLVESLHHDLAHLPRRQNDLGQDILPKENLHPVRHQRY
eukprot:CAMPEP_0201898598 /NCGR_PEP_ID=MMETSP0902-20130614/48799_1 /ASSEMBLY_ACC=CAM_ASM_000551 /TAXON_ID=420261 /ORGANISM="Thalassiosira antarctica, Strain CCMP982" /LENGTH=51 /DNA_ID=CAMNT_0048431799 /DNA_START=99 /DNA_END=254 /DNA_ORIENTATION=-